MPVMLSEPVASAVAAESLVASVEAAALEEVVLLAELPQAAKESAMQAAMVKARYFFMCDLLIFYQGRMVCIPSHTSYYTVWQCFFQCAKHYKSMTMPFGSCYRFG